MNPKQRAAEAALSFVHDGMTVGLGTGSTAEYFITALGKKIREGAIKGVTGVPTSIHSESLARVLGIPLATLAERPVVDVTVDGADEIDPSLALIKGLGGALLREKIVAQNSKKLVIIADESKVVPFLGSKGPLPVEVAQFCHQSHVDFFETLGATSSTLRTKPDKSTFVTDNGNFIYDCRFPRIADPAALETALDHRAGIVECGLFVNIARVVLVGTDTTVRQLNRA